MWILEPKNKDHQLCLSDRLGLNYVAMPMRRESKLFVSTYYVPVTVGSTSLVTLLFMFT